jgi:hypothetical protein
MTVGNQPTVASINEALTSLAVQWRNLAQQTIWLNQQIGNLGATGLENLGGTGAGFSSADASVVLASAGNLADMAGIYQGLAPGLTLPFNFRDNTVPLWGGQ